MTKPLQLLLKFPKGGSLVTDTITQLRMFWEAENRLIWGQPSDKFTNGVALKNRIRIKNQIGLNVNTYTFFLANIKGKRELYVGKMANIYGIGEIDSDSPLTMYIPNHNPSQLSIPNLFVEVTTFFRIDQKFLSNITLESTKEPIISVKNSNTIFLVNIDEELENFLNEMIINLEANFQYQIELEEVPEDVTMDDIPKEKPLIALGSGTGTFKRNFKTSKAAIVLAKYKCEIDINHVDFISRVTGQNYVEAHHLIPMEYQDDYANSIDVEANIVSLCVSCHKKMHHAKNEIIKPLIEKLYDNRVARLKDCDIEVTAAKLLTYYK